MGNLDYFIQQMSKFTQDYKHTKDLNQHQHIEKWIYQFDSRYRLNVLSELYFILQKTYISEQMLFEWCYNTIRCKPKEFWERMNFLDIQTQGESQKNILKMVNLSLKMLYHIDIKQCGTNSKEYIYFDDIIFSGSRVIQDIKKWIKYDAQDMSKVYIVTFFAHEYGLYFCKKQFPENLECEGKHISFCFYSPHILENRAYHVNDKTPDIFWPKKVDDEVVHEYIDNLQTRYSFIPRESDNKSKYFSCEENRQILERELLLAGIKIVNFCKAPNSIMKPLGFSHFGIGFGSTIVTYRNCPNNCPLALWWGDSNAPASHPLGKWYPLFPRKTYEQS